MSMGQRKEKSKEDQKNKQMIKLPSKFNVLKGASDDNSVLNLRRTKEQLTTVPAEVRSPRDPRAGAGGGGGGGAQLGQRWSRRELFVSNDWLAVEIDETDHFYCSDLFCCGFATVLLLPQPGVPRPLLESVAGEFPHSNSLQWENAHQRAAEKGLRGTVLLATACVDGMQQAGHNPVPELPGGFMGCPTA